MHVYIERNSLIIEHGIYTYREFAALLRKYKKRPTVIDFLSKMLED